MNNSYHNYISGPISQVSGCLEIILYNKSSFSERVSVYNLKNFYLKYLMGSSSDKHVRLGRESAIPEVRFRYNRQLEKGFNIIIYLDPDSSLPVGYTEFINTYGEGVVLDIGVNIRRTLKGMLDLEISNRLVGKDLSKKFLGKDISMYSSLSDITERSYRNLFTNNTERLVNDSFSFIISSSGFLTNKESWKLGVNRDITIQSGLENYNICFYNGDLVLACWEGKNYALYSLIGTNTSLEGTTKEDIQKIEGRYFLNKDGLLKYLDEEDGDLNRSVFLENHGTQFVDFQNKKCTAYNLPIFYTKSDILKYIPEINNIYLDLDNYLRSSQLVIHSKIGSWFIFRANNYSEESIIYIAVSPTSVIYLTEEDLKTAIFVGDQTMILREDDPYYHYYYVYNTSEIELYTERARAVLFNGRLDWWGDPENELIRFKFCFSDNTEEDDKHFEEYFGENGIVHVVYGYEELSITVLMKYRRNIYPDYPDVDNNCRIPTLIGSYGGLIFYNNNNKISFL